MGNNLIPQFRIFLKNVT